MAENEGNKHNRSELSVGDIVIIVSSSKDINGKIATLAWICTDPGSTLKRVSRYYGEDAIWTYVRNVI